MFNLMKKYYKKHRNHWQLKKIDEFERDLLQREIDTNGKILDIGCGKNPLGVLCNDNLRYVGIDILKDSLKYLKTRHRELMLVQASMLKLPFSSSSFDYITALGHVLGHIDAFGRKNTIIEFYRCLKSGGKLIFSVWSDTCKYLRHINENLPDMIPVSDVENNQEYLFLHFFSYKEIKELLESVNFKIIGEYLLKEDGSVGNYRDADIYGFVCVK
jgi:SAM-dependent methyltransferase